MKPITDAATFAALVSKAKQEQQERQKSDQILGPMPYEVNDYRAGKIAFDDLDLDTVTWLMREQKEIERNDPYPYSKLPQNLQLETWTPRDALLLLAGVAPSEAMVYWPPENVRGTGTDKPIIRSAAFLSDTLHRYDMPPMPESSHDDGYPWCVAGALRLRSEMLEILARRWYSGNHDTEARHPPAYFVQWAEKRGFEIEWTGWARDNGLLDGEPPTTEPQPASQAAVAQAPQKSPKNQRSDLLAPLIREAAAISGYDTARTFALLRDWAHQKRQPLLGVTEDGIQWVDGGENPKTLNTGALRERIRVITRKKPQGNAG